LPKTITRPRTATFSIPALKAIAELRGLDAFANGDDLTNTFETAAERKWAIVQAVGDNDVGSVDTDVVVHPVRSKHDYPAYLRPNPWNNGT
jgi:hypothetical protein